jgi:transcriptional regulator with XRE-family HTH domain
MTPHEILDRLRQERLRAGLSLQQLADRHGAQQPTVRSHEAGERALTLAQLVEHAGWFGLEVVLRPVDASAPDAYQRGYDQAVVDACKAWGVRTDDQEDPRRVVDWDAALDDAYDEIEQENTT